MPLNVLQLESVHVTFLSLLLSPTPLSLPPLPPQDGTVLDEKDISPLSLVDAVLRDSSLTQRPSQTKVELTSSHDTPSAAGGAMQESGVKSENAGQGKHPVLHILHS